MKPKDVRALSDAELRQKERDLTEALFNLRFQRATGQLGNLMRIRQVKQDRARVRTEQRARMRPEGPARGA